MTPDLDYEDFSGGFADITSLNDRKTGNIVQNFDITTEKKLRERSGSAILDATASLVSASAGGVRENGRTGSLINYGEDLHLIIRSKGALYAKNAATWDSATAWTKMSSRNTGFEALPSYRALTALAALVSSEYQGNTLLVGQDASYTTPEYAIPTKAYLDDSNTFKVQNATLPEPGNPTSLVDYTRILNGLCVLANDLKTQFNVHTNTLGVHTTQTTPVTAATAVDESTLLTLTKDLVTQYNLHTNDSLAITDSGVSIHRVDNTVLSGVFATTGPRAMGSFPHTGIPELFTAFDCLPILNRLRFGFNCHLNAFMQFDQSQIDASFPAQGGTVTFDVATSKMILTGTYTGEFDRVFRTGDQLHFRGTVPTGLTVGTPYFVINSGGFYRLASSFANAAAGTYIVLSGVYASVKGYYHSQNLHGILTQAVTAPYVYLTPFAPTDLAAVAGLPSSPNPPPHVSWQWLAGINALYGQFYTHLSTNHAHTAANGYLLDASTFMSTWSSFSTTGQATDDWDSFMAILKMHAWYRIHRLEGVGEYHVNATTDTAATALTLGVENYKFDFIPDVFDSAFWNQAYLLFKDMSDHFLGVNTFDSGGTPAAAASHQAVSARHSSVPATYVPIPFKFTFVNRRYALLVKNTYKTFENRLFEDISAPLVSTSFAIVRLNTFEDLTNENPNLITYALGFTNMFALFPWGSTLFEIPAIDNNPTTTARYELYRTIDNGTTFYLARSFAQADLTGKTFVIDSSSDEGITSLGQLLYTTGGVVANDQVPQCAGQVRVGDTHYFGGIREESTPQILLPTSYAGTSITLAGHGLSNGQQVVFWNQTPLAGAPIADPIVMGKPYFVKNAATNTFEIATSPNGTSLTFTSSPAVGTVFMGVQRFTTYPRRIRQSITGTTYASPATFFAEMDSDFVALGSAQEYPIVICKQGIYRVEGTFAEDGTGGMVLKKVSDRIGGVSANGGITVNDLYYFMGRDGFYVTDGFKVSALSSHLKDTYKEIIDASLSGFSAKNSQIQCTYNRTENRIQWSVNRGNSDYATEIWTLYLNQSQSDRGSFTIRNNGTHFYPTAIGFFRNQLLRGDTQGFVFAHQAAKTNDPKIDRTSTGSLVSGVAVAIPFQYRSLAEDFGSKGARKLVSRLMVQCENLGNLTMAIRSINDKAAAYITSLFGIRFRQEYQGIVKEKRTFPVPTTQTSNFQGTRCFSKQVDFTPGNATLYASDQYALANLTGGALTLASGTWPIPDGSLVDCEVAFETDNYVTGYVISAASASTLTLTAPPANFTGKKWIIRGIPKDELVQLNSYSLIYQGVDAQPSPPTATATGANT